MFQALGRLNDVVVGPKVRVYEVLNLVVEPFANAKRRTPSRALGLLTLLQQVGNHHFAHGGKRACKEASLPVAVKLHHVPQLADAGDALQVCAVDNSHGKQFRAEPKSLGLLDQHIVGSLLPVAHV